MSYLSNIKLDTKNLYEIKLKFYELFNSDINTLTENNKYTVFIDYLKNNFYLKEKYDKINIDFQYLFIITNLLFEYNNEISKIKIDTFNKEYLYPIIVSLISTEFKEIKKFISLNIRKVFKEFENISKDVLDFFYILSKIDKNLIINDVIEIFFCGLFVENEPLKIENLKEYYINNFKYIFYSYLKNKTSGMLNKEIPTSFIETDSSNSTRLKIYERAIKVSQISEMCTTSVTLKRINENFEGLKNKIITNDLQHLYNIFNEKKSIQSKKVSILEINNSNLDDIKIKFPLIYKLLKSLKVKGESTFTDIDKLNIRNKIFDNIFSILKEKLDENYSKLIVRNISNDITINLTNGKFIDAISLTPIELNNETFLNEFGNFIKYLLEKNSIC